MDVERMRDAAAQAGILGTKLVASARFPKFVDLIPSGAESRRSPHRHVFSAPRLLTWVKIASEVRVFTSTQNRNSPRGETKP